MPRNHARTATEIELHRAVAEFLAWAVLPPAVWTTFPSGWTAMRKGAAGRLRACGLQPGMPDILIFHGGHTLAIELKTLHGRLSDVQRDMHVRLETAGVPVRVVRSFADLDTVLVAAGIPMRKVRLHDAPPRP